MSEIKKRKKIINYYDKTNLKIEIQNTISRLENDVGNYIYFLSLNNFKCGYFGMVRLLFPIIEHLQKILPKKRGEKIKQVVFNELGIKYPEILTYMYRHALTHGDSPIELVIGKKRFFWMLSFNRGSHDVIKLNKEDHLKKDEFYMVCLDLMKLYKDLVSYLYKLESNTKEKTTVKIQKQIKVIKSDKNNSEVCKEVENISESNLE